MPPIDPATPARILLLRHAETAAPDRFHGCESDVELGRRGRQQAEAVARRLASLRPAAVYSSGLRRARATAEAIARAGRIDDVRVIDALHERRMGPLSNTPRHQTWPIYEEARRRWSAGDLEHTHDGGESFAQIRDRVAPILEQVARRHPGETAVVVAHGIVIRVLLCTLLDDLGPADFGRISIDPVRVYDLRHGEGRGWTLAGTIEGAEPAPEARPW